MDLPKLYKMQSELDNYIWDKHGTLEKMSKEELLDSTILALLVEVGELANTTRCFKHWSTKGIMAKEVVLDELADVLHFYLSIGNQIEYELNWEEVEYGNQEATRIDMFMNLYYWSMELGNARFILSLGGRQYKKETTYKELGIWLKVLWDNLGFTDKEVEQAYLKKHEENYKRQEEGY